MIVYTPPAGPTIDEAISKYNQNEKSELLLIKKLIENNN